MATTETTQAVSQVNLGQAAAPPRTRGYLTTASELAALRERVERLRMAKHREIADRLHDARVYGDPSVNDEYMAIREDEGVLEGRIRALERLINDASVVEHEPPREGVVAIGSIVRIEDLRSQRVERLRITTGLDAGGVGTVSAASPIGRALLGRHKGARLEIPLPGGRWRALKIRDVEPGPGPA